MRQGLAERKAVTALQSAMFDGRDFVFSATREEVARIETPMLVLQGLDIFHPSETAREIARLAPHAKLIETWRDAGPGALQAAAERIEGFLTEHSGMHMFI